MCTQAIKVPRLDYDERYEDVPGAPECWVDGYDAGFAGKYNIDRANECKEIPGDQFNASWEYGCIDSGRTKTDCDNIKDNPVDAVNPKSLKEENRRTCYDDGYEDGGNNMHMIAKENKDVPSSVIHIEMGSWQLVSLAILMISVILDGNNTNTRTNEYNNCY